MHYGISYTLKIIKIFQQCTIHSVIARKWISNMWMFPNWRKFYYLLWNQLHSKKSHAKCLCKLSKIPVINFHLGAIKCSKTCMLFDTIIYWVHGTVDDKYTLSSPISVTKSLDKDHISISLVNKSQFKIIWERPNSTLNTFTFHGQSAFYNLWDGKFLSLKTSLNVASRM